jgi:hypothetical protein
VTPDPAERAELLARARERLQASLDDLLGDRLRAGGRPPRDPAGWVEVRDADVVGRCAARFAHPEPSQWSDLTTVTATRTLGRLVLRERDPSESPDATLDRILAGADDLPAWLANGLEPLDRSAVAAVRASVLAWVADALTPVRGRTDLAWDGTTERVTVPGRAVQLVARWDARLGSRRSPTTLLVHSPRVVDRADDLVAAGFVALVACHHSGVAPERIRFSTAGTGATRAVAITGPVLSSAVERIVELVGHAVEPDRAPITAGRWCRWCHRLDDCEVGRAAVAPPDARRPT